MAVRERGKGHQIEFEWKGHRMYGACPVRNKVEARKIEKSLKTAFKIYRFDHLEPVAMAVVIRMFENKGWDLPSDLKHSLPEEQRTLFKAIRDYLEADEKHRTERNLYAIDRVVEHFGEDCPLTEIKVPQIRRYQRARQEKRANGTVNKEVSVLSGIFRAQVELEHLDFNPCLMVKRLPENQRDSYLSWEDFNSLLEHSSWLSDIITVQYYTGMRFNEVVNLRWEMYKPERRMLVLPPSVTKEGKSERKARLQTKRIPLRMEVAELLESLGGARDAKVVRAMGLIFTYQGRYRDHCGTYQGKPVCFGMVRKAWRSATTRAGLKGLQLKDLRHTWKTNAHRSGIDPSVRNAIVGHSSQRSVEDRYIRLSDEVLRNAVDSMIFDHGASELDMVLEA
jgi:integrase